MGKIRILPTNAISGRDSDGNEEGAFAPAMNRSFGNYWRNNGEQFKFAELQQLAYEYIRCIAVQAWNLSVMNAAFLLVFYGTYPIPAIRFY